ncbi:phospholipid scramblase 2-like [Tiliqua scincoides]|uniref:phospholipid scramblase 2-like n=1 Tax=Tiliqua scincoides TaxID=71010 RepID=UPI0034629DB6
MQSKASAPGQPTPGYPGPGYPGPGYPGAQAQHGYPQYAPGQSFPGAPGQPPYVTQSYPGVYSSPAVTGQPNAPGGAMWMPAPPTIPNCPPGLEYLTQIDQLLIHQQIELLEILTGFETANKYEIKNALGQRIYFAAEENDCCTLNCCGASRPFTMKIVDNLGQHIIELIRPLRCSSCCFPCCLQELEVHAPPGTPVGYIKQIWHPCLPKFVIQNEAREDILKIVGPCVVCSCCADIHFEVMSVDEKENVGRISKQWTGFVKEAFTDADNFGIQFPMNLDVKMKAVMLGACFLIDFMFFEHTGQNKNQRAGVW